MATQQYLAVQRLHQRVGGQQLRQAGVARYARDAAAPEILERAHTDVHLVANLIALSDVIPPSSI